MYEDVIKLVKTNIETHLEGEIMQAVMHVGVEVNKEELLRALAYDRGQYEQGYKDGQPKWISVKERLPEDDQDVLVCVKGGTIDTGYCAWARDPGSRGWTCYASVSNDVTHWMPLPEPPENT